METDADELFYNPFQDGYDASPYEHYDEMRSGEPVHLSLGSRWFLFRYDDVNRLLREPSLSVDTNQVELVDEEREATIEAAYGPEGDVSTALLAIDPPDHTRLKRLVMKAFTPTTVANMRPMVEQQVSEIYDAMEARGGGDILRELAFQLPADTIADMLGIPDEDKEQMGIWSAALAKTLDPIISEEEAFEAAHAERDMNVRLEEIIADKRQNLTDDVISGMIRAQEDGDRMSTVEIRDQAQLIFSAGHDTTKNLLSLGVLEMIRRPDQAELWRNDASLGPNAVEELLRFVSPAQFTRRVTVEEIEVGGEAIPEKNFLMMGLGSANHDPDKWGPTANQLDITRSDAAQQLAFGAGQRYCLGAALARLEGEVAIGEFVRRFPKARLVEDPAWNGRINLRGVDRLMVAVD